MSEIKVSKILILVIWDEIKIILYFPLWWYGRGFLGLLKRAETTLIEFEQTLGFFIWVKNLFVPMFGQTDFAGRIISFFLRLFQIFVKGIVLLIFIAIMIVIIFIWLLLPPFVLYQAFIHIY